MLRSMYAGVAGLKTHQTKMDVIGNNIANVNTTSYKSQSITFSDLMYQTTKSASGATATTGGVNASQIGLGAQSAAIATAIDTQGATQTTNNPFDIMITGDSFFIVNDGTQNYYTRDGSFYIDGQGNLATQADGFYVMGWKATTDADTGATTINTNGGLTSLQIMTDATSTYPPEGTSAAVVTGNIDANDTNVTSSAGKTLALEFYDNKGYLYTAQFTIKDVADASGKTVANQFTMQLADILDSSGSSIGAAALANVAWGANLTTDANTSSGDAGTLNKGVMVTYNSSAGTVTYANTTVSGTTYAAGTTIGTILASAANTTGVTAADVAYSGTTNTSDLTVITSSYIGFSDVSGVLNFSGSGTAEPVTSYTIDDDGNISVTTASGTYNVNRNTVNLIFNAATGSISNFASGQTQPILDFTPDTTDGTSAWTDITFDLTTIKDVNTSGTSTLQASKGNLAGNNTGRMMGTLSGITVSKSGEINATYSNGQTLLLAQIASASFDNASGLEKQGGNLYASTLNSGDPVVQDITTDGGKMTTGVLEMSNVDLSTEFTNMITAQRGFQANSRIITVSDTLLEELTNLKR